jgi:predicted AlkP superfamily pyrophosphatase or phosphodiesterase
VGISQRRGSWIWRGALAAVAVSSAALFVGHTKHARATPIPATVAPIVAASVDAGEPPSAFPVLHGRVKHVVIVSEDGLRPDALEQLHLHWHELLKQKGTWGIHAMTIRDASTLPAHASMLSGVHPAVHGLTWNNWQPARGYIKSPTIFTYAKQAGLSTAFFTGKKKLRHIVPPGSVEMYERPGYYCKKVAEDAAAYLVEEKPVLTFVHFADPDELGHSEGWMSSGQMHAIANSDRCLGQIYTALEEAHMIEDTLIVTADHGGHNKVHSGATKIDRLIPWIAVGPGVKEGFTLTDEISTLDTAATALYALGLPVPDSFVGKARTDIFTLPQAVIPLTPPVGALPAHTQP